MLVAAMSHIAVASTLVLGFPSGLTRAPDGAVIVADRRADRVFRIDIDTGALTVIAGTGERGFSGDGGPATQAMLKHPEWVVFDSRGNLLIADRGNHRVRRIDADTGVICTIVGNGDYDESEDGGSATDVALSNPFGLAVDTEDNLYVFDTEVHRIRRVDAETGIITAAIGTGEEGFSGDGGPGIEATMFRPHNGCFDADGALVFGDSFNQRIRRWDPASGIIETIAGTGEEGPPRIGARGTESPFTYFGAMVVEPDGDLVITSLDHRIVRLRASDGVLELVAGTGVAGFSGDGGPATQAQLQTPYGLLRTKAGDLIFSDAGNARVRRIDARTGVITTIAP